MIPIGYDSYYYINMIAGIIPINDHNPVMEKFILPFLKWLVTKTSLEFTVAATLFFLMGVMLLSTILLVKEVFPKANSILTIIVTLGCPLFFLECLKFENDQFAYALIFFAMWLYVRGIKKDNNFLVAFSMLVLLSTGFIWQGAFLIFPGFFFNKLTMILGAIFFFPVYFSWKWLGSGFLWPMINSAIEQIPLIGVPFLFGLNLGLVFYLNNTKGKELKYMALYLFAICAFMAKFAMLCVPLLVLGVIGLSESDWKWKSFLKTFATITFLLSTTFIFFFPVNPPQQYHMDSIDYAIQKSKLTGKPIKNDWDYGHWVYYRGGSPSEIAGGNIMDQNFDYSIALTTIELDKSSYSCELNKKYNEILVYDCP